MLAFAVGHHAVVIAGAPGGVCGGAVGPYHRVHADPGCRRVQGHGVHQGLVNLSLTGNHDLVVDHGDEHPVRSASCQERRQLVGVLGGWCVVVDLAGCELYRYWKGLAPRLFAGRRFELSETITSVGSIPNIATRVRTSRSFAVVTALIRLRGRHSLPVWAMTGPRLACWYSSFCAIRSASLINSGTG